MTVSWKGTHRDAALIQGKTHNGTNIGSVVPRPLYCQQMFLRRIADGNSPIWIVLPDHVVVASRTKILCRLIDLKINRTQDARNPLLYNYSLKFKQIRGAPAQS